MNNVNTMFCWVWYVPFSLALDNGLKLYWLGGLVASGGSVVVPGVTYL